MRGAGDQQWFVVESLEAVNHHLTIVLGQEIRSQFNRAVRRDAEQVRVKRRVVKLAQRQAVRDDVQFVRSLSTQSRRQRASLSNSGGDVSRLGPQREQRTQEQVD